jgi:DNA-binding CsgD family transcriptional regulator
MTFIASELLLLSVPTTATPPAAVAAQLTPAERAVATLAIEGLSNADIAARRGSSARTVASQLASVYLKLGAGGRRELRARFAAGRRVPRGRIAGATS